MQTIVIAFDDTEPSKRALERAADIAEKFDSRLVVTSVAPVLHPAGRSMGGGVDPTDPPAHHEDELAHARSYLEGRGVAADFQPGLGDAAETIVEVADEADADLIVVGARELNAIQRLLGQSVSQAVAHHSHRDVLIVH